MCSILMLLSVLLAGEGLAEPFGAGARLDARISVSFADADVADVLKAFSKDYGINLVVEEGITGKVTANFADTRIGDALDAVLAMVDCGWECRGDIVLIFQSKPIRKVFAIDYAMSEEFKAEISRLLSETGTLAIDPASSSIMVIDRPANVERISAFLELSDSQRQQVMIEASIVEVALGKDDEMGVNWKWLDSKILGLEGVSGTLTQGLAPAGPGASDDEDTWDGFGFAVSHHRASFLLQAIAKHTNVDLLSAPRVATLNNRKAVIKVIERVPYIKASTDIAQAGYVSTREEVEFEEVGIMLEATPQIGPDGAIFLNIKPEISEVTAWFNKQPVVDKRSVETSVKVSDGETVIIGGLLRNGTTQAISKVPVLGDVPGLGLLLRHKVEVDQKTELLIFISPRIVTAESARKDAGSAGERLDRMRSGIHRGLLR
jgi:type II secretory pathway component GspD/PulD (secretin)